MTVDEAKDPAEGRPARIPRRAASGTAVGGVLKRRARRVCLPAPGTLPGDRSGEARRPRPPSRAGAVSAVPVPGSPPGPQPGPPAPVTQAMCDG